MKLRTIVANLASAVLGGVVLVCVVVLETVLVFIAVLPPGREGGAVGWDPVSLWSQSPVYGKLLLVVVVAVLVVIPVLAFVWVFRYVHRRLSVARIARPSS